MSDDTTTDPREDVGEILREGRRARLGHRGREGARGLRTDSAAAGDRPGASARAERHLHVRLGAVPRLGHARAARGRRPSRGRRPVRLVPEVPALPAAHGPCAAARAGMSGQDAYLRQVVGPARAAAIATWWSDALQVPGRRDAFYAAIRKAVSRRDFAALDSTKALYSLEVSRDPCRTLLRALRAAGFECQFIWSARGLLRRGRMRIWRDSETVEVSSPGPAVGWTRIFGPPRAQSETGR